MRKILLLSLIILAVGMAPGSAALVQVARIHDGDTLTLSSGEKVRFLQIDTPELSPAECYGAQAHKALVDILGKAKKIGLWKSCPTAKLEPLKAATTGAAGSALNATTSSDAKCDPNYQGCLPPYPPDLDCSDIKKMGLAPIRVIGVDVHKLDGDGDGIGCDK